MLGKVGLTTQGQLDQAQAKKEIWHSLVRDVFARYYIKMRQAFPDHLPDLPRKYSPNWEDHIKAELGNFLNTDLQNVAPLLHACGFGTGKWHQFVEKTLPEMNEIIDAHLNDEAPDTGEQLIHDLSNAQKEIRQLRSAGRRALERLKGYEQQLNSQRNGGEDKADRGENGEAFTALFPKYSDIDEDPDSKDDYLDSSPIDEPLEDTDDPAIDDLFAEDTKPATDLATSGSAPSNEPAIDDDSAELRRKNKELQGKLAFSDKKVETLNKQLEDLEEDLRLVPHAERLPTGDEDDLRSDRQDSNQEFIELQQRNNQIQRDLNAKDQTIGVLRKRIGVMEREIGAARNQLLVEVKQLKALTSSKIELKPVEELDQMKADDLLEYAQNVASDIDIRRQILDEGLKGVSKLEENYAESRQRHEKQQQEMEEQFEKMAADLEDYQQKMVEAEENAEKAAEIAREAKAAGAVAQDQGEATEHLRVVATQRDQLQLLSNRVKLLQSSNKELQGSNDKMYKDLDTAVKRLIPLRNQIEELEALRDALDSFIRNNHDRNFSIHNIQEKR